MVSKQPVDKLRCVGMPLTSEELHVKHQIAQIMSHKAIRWIAFALFLLLPGSLLLLPLLALLRVRLNKGEAA